MSRDRQHNPDPNENAARIVRESTASTDQPLPPDLERAWAEWSRGVQKVDERGMTLLRAAFEAGAAAQKASLARAGGLSGGKARAAVLTRSRRSEIAKKAAAARWKQKDVNG